MHSKAAFKQHYEHNHAIVWRRMQTNVCNTNCTYSMHCALSMHHPVKPWAWASPPTYYQLGVPSGDLHRMAAVHTSTLLEESHLLLLCERTPLLLFILHLISRRSARPLSMSRHVSVLPLLLAKLCDGGLANVYS